MSNSDPRPDSFPAASSRNTSRSRSGTPQPEGLEAENAKPCLQRSQGRDHTVSQVHRISAARYPRDCPPLKTRWFYAVDTPKSKPSFWGKEAVAPKSQGAPKKFVPFSIRDSQSIEAAFQDLADREDAAESSKLRDTPRDPSSQTVKVPVNEDYLFDVDVQKRELGPAYWQGPIYEVRRGSWFFQEGSNLRPCDENLATQLEEGYLKVKPWNIQRKRSSSNPLASNVSLSSKDHRNAGSLNSNADQVNKEGPSHVAAGAASSASKTMNETYRLFGSYMNNTVAYQDESTAWLMSDDFVSRMSNTVYQRLGATAGSKVVRGYSESKKVKELADGKAAELTPKNPTKSIKRQSAPPDSLSSPLAPDDNGQDQPLAALERQRSPLERQMSSLTGERQDDDQIKELEEQARKQEEKEMVDSGEVEGEEEDREIDHLILVTHGIGQRLGLRLDSINFVHDVNVLRKTMKSVYAASTDLQALNSQVDSELKNCRVQVLPVCWRHLLDFPKQGLKQHRKELDLADADKMAAEDEHYPSLADITLEGVPAVRNLITDLAMDVLLYQSAYREHIAGIVQRECNRIYKLFKDRNPTFKGSVSLCGHSLGSAILFDILCHQPSDSGHTKPPSRDSKRAKIRTAENRQSEAFLLDFECADFFCLGSPIALFQMLKGKTIAGRDLKSSKFSRQSYKPTDSHNISTGTSITDSTGSPCFPNSVSSPKCNQLFNIFHPSDPISYRIEPLISPAMAALKPQPLPYVKRTIWSTSGQSLTNISTRVGQSVGSLWSQFASGVASSFLNRSLGLSDGSTQPQSAAGGPLKIAGLGSDSDNEKSLAASGEVVTNEPSRSQKYPTLIDANIETLYDGFQKTRSSPTDIASGSESSTIEDIEAENRARKIRYEEAKVRALNSNGRVDYSIQEGAFDISLIASIASHLSYWADEDVSHFIMSQMLSRTRKERRDGKTTPLCER
ncbi:DDHD domain-containing protein [Blastomyces dermatitidis ER-3]|uniref:DDHD domain-containing protein n=1 Tax=Ajellomyces dermatitidis (strain ER-3 / ATCC MYA-2586) TaxID=559297 RepID=A0ABP2EPG2_AJEDR|nr:DDHD domain-containing protein [Blastomyces dermatitidis ER-3]EEQ83497.1 DDHD domain-containing protein [Blastomyces dermatitidis ER-3]